MAKRRKKKSSSAGAHGPSQIKGAGNIASNQSNFGGLGVNPRQQRAAQKVRDLVGEGYRLNPTGPTSKVYKDAVKGNTGAASRLGKLLKGKNPFR